MASRLDRRQIEKASWFFSKLPKKPRMVGGGTVGRVWGFVERRGKFIPSADGVCSLLPENRQVNTLAQRLQNCFGYSLNGTAPVCLSRVLLALEVYSHSLANGAPTGRNRSGCGCPSLGSLLHRMSCNRGWLVFRNYCLVCHGKDGQGRLARSSTQGFPSPCGRSSLNWGTGIANMQV